MIKNGKTRVRSSIQKRLILYVAALVAAIMALSCIFCGLYFSEMMKKRLLQDYSEIIQYSSAQLINLSDEVEQYAAVIAANKDLQLSLSQNDLPLGTVRRKYRINGILQPYYTLNNMIQSIEVETADGSRYAGGTLAWEADEGKWKKYMTNMQGFSAMHEVLIGKNREKVITYCLPINNYYDNTQNCAMLYLHIQYSRFQELLQRELMDFHWAMVQAKDGRTIYFQGADGITEKEIRNKIKEIQWTDTDLWMAGHDVVLRQEMHDKGMTLLMSTTDENIRRQIRFVYSIFGLLFLVSLIIGIVGIWLISERITGSIKTVTQAARRIRDGEKGVFVEVKGQDEISVLSDVFNEMVRSIGLQMEQIKKVEREKNELKMDILMAQINPHFIYNTLDSAIYLSRAGENKKVERLIRAFVQLLQDNMKTGTDGIIASVGEEEQCIRNYLEIQSIRYPGRFVTGITIEEDIRSLSIPRLILQPFVENSLNHGILPEERPGKIQVALRQEKDSIRIFIEDDGAGIDEEDLEKILQSDRMKENGKVRSIGIANVKERLQLIYKDQYDLNIQSYPGEGTRIEIRIPMYFK